jgi:hypothetical protein
MIGGKQIIYSAQEYDKEWVNHTMRTAIIKTTGMHAIIIYTSNGDNMRLVNADIFFTGAKYTHISGTPDRLFIKNASLSELAEKFA